MTYKPLTDEELFNQEHAMFAPRGMPHNQMYNLLLQQARRANALVKTGYRCSSTCICPKCEALAAYLGED